MSKKKTSIKKVTKPVTEVKEEIWEPREKTKEVITTFEDKVVEKKLKKKFTRNQLITGLLSLAIVVIPVVICILLVNNSQASTATEVKVRVFGNEVQYSLGTKWVNAGDVDELKAQDLTNDGTEEADNPVKIIARGQGSETEVEKVTYSGGYSRPSSSGGSSSGGTSGGKEGQDIVWSGDVGVE